MKCVNCNHEQETGKFCGKCGTPFVEGGEVKQQGTEQIDGHQQDKSAVKSEQAASTQTEQPYIPPAEPSVHVENVKKQTRKYWDYFLQFIKQPSLIFSRSQSEVTNALISSCIFAIIVALSMYIYTDRLLSSFNSFFYEDTNFFNIFFGSVLFILLSLAVVALVLFLIAKLFGPDLSFKQVLSIYGAHINPAIFIALLGLLLLVLEVNKSGLIISSLALFYAICAIPPYIISRLLVNQPKSMDPFYSYTLYLVGISIAFYIVFKVLAESSIKNTINHFLLW